MEIADVRSVAGEAEPSPHRQPELEVPGVPTEPVRVIVDALARPVPREVVPEVVGADPETLSPISHLTNSAPKEIDADKTKAPSQMATLRGTRGVQIMCNTLL